MAYGEEVETFAPPWMDTPSLEAVLRRGFLSLLSPGIVVPSLHQKILARLLACSLSWCVCVCLFCFDRQRREAANKQKAELEGRLSTLDKSYTSEFETRVKTNMAAARQALKTAIESQDVDGQIAAQEQISNLTMDAARLNAMKVAAESKPKEVNVTPQQTRQSAQTDPMAEAWAAENAWFGNDSAMTYTAFDIHKQLVEKEGFDPKSKEYYDEVDKRIRVEFPHKFDKIEDNTTERAKPVQNVASAKRSASTSKGRKTVKLTPSQVAIAKRLGVPLEEYAKQLNITEGV